MDYYFFVSSLPSLTFSKNKSMDVNEFLESAKEHLSKKDYEYLLGFSYDLSKESSSLIYKFLKDIKIYALSILRNEKLDHSDLDASIKEKIKNIISNSNPLEIEVEIMKLQFEFAKEFSTLNPFKIENLCTYYLQLQILQRLNSFDKLDGLSVFKSIAKNVQSR